MKNLIEFIKRIVSRIKGYKIRNKKTHNTLVEVLSPVKERKIKRGITKKTNNRKRTNGRRIQEITIGKSSKFIFH